MTGEDARTICNGWTVTVNGYSVITRQNARHLLGKEVYDRLCSDKVRGIGPTEDTFYAWSVATYLEFPQLNAENGEEIGDFEQFELDIAKLVIPIEDFITKHFGERCPDYEENCENCRRWGAYARLIENPFEPGE